VRASSGHLPQGSGCTADHKNKINSSLALSSLASSVNTSNIVNQLITIERKKVTAITTQQATVTAHQTALKGISDKLNTLRSAGLALAGEDVWKSSPTVTSSDQNVVTASLTEGAGLGGHTIQVDRLASSAQHGYTYTPSAGATTITVGSATIPIAANASMKDVAKAINASTDAPAVAAVIKAADGTDRLVLSSRKTGHDADFTASLTEDPDYARTGATLDASYKLDGVARTSTTNDLTDALPGLKLSLRSLGMASVTATEATPDKAGAKAKVHAFVDAYNAVVDLVKTQTKDKTSPLFGDRQLDSMLSTIKGVLQSSIASIGTHDSLSDIGISVPKSTGSYSADALLGKMTVDDTALDSALGSDWGQVRNLFNGVGARKGFAWQINDAVNAQVSAKGILTGRITSDSKTITTMGKRIDDTNQRLTMTESRMKAQFAAMETALSNAQAQQAWLTGQIASLSNK
jgi:flagellar hook-associated protein 2